MKIERLILESKSLKQAAEKIHNVMMRNEIEPESLPCLVKTIKGFKIGKTMDVAYLQAIENKENERLRKVRLEDLAKRKPIDIIQRAITNLDEKIQEWTEKFKENPFYQLTWGTVVFQAAAKRKVYLEVREYLERYIGEDKAKWEEYVEEIKKNALSKAASPSFSTSPMSNLGEIYLGEVYARIARKDDWVTMDIWHWFNQMEELTTDKPEA